MIDQQVRFLMRKPSTMEGVAADIRRLTARIEARREAAPDNVVELAALAVDLQRATAAWQRLSPPASGDELAAGYAAASCPTHSGAARAHLASVAADRALRAASAH